MTYGEASVYFGAYHSDFQRELSRHKQWWNSHREGGIGTFLGHFFLAMVFMLPSISYLVLLLKRARNLPPNRGFAELHIPERDRGFMSKFSKYVMVLIVIGLFSENVSAYFRENAPFFNWRGNHKELAFPFFTVTLTMYFESKGHLPFDTHRGVLVLTFLTSALFWKHHSQMRPLPIEKIAHEIIGYINFANALVMAYSMRFTDSTLAYVTGWALMTLQGMWILTIGLYLCCIDISMEHIIGYFTFECFFLTLILLLVVVFFGPNHKRDEVEIRGLLDGDEDLKLMEDNKLELSPYLNTGDEDEKKETSAFSIT